MASNLALDLAVTRRHLAALDPECDRHIFAGFHKTTAVKRPALHLVGTLNQHAAELERMQLNGYGIYVTVNGMAGHRRRKSEIAKVRSCWAERDGPGKRLPLAAS